MLNPWFSVILKAMQLGFESQNVIALRMMRLAAGGTTAQTEVRRMIADKTAAGIEAQAAAAASVASGHRDTAVAGKVLRVLKKRVRANKRRLSRR
jgi:geranylgeranyl pyrophosphate synthase